MKFMSRWRLRKPAEDAETPYVSEKFGVRSLHIGSDTIQSSMRIARPYDLELSYTRSMMAFLLFKQDLQDVLMIGLGGGSLAKYFHRHLPTARTEVVELNPLVVGIARQCFGVPADDDRLTITVADGAGHVACEGPLADLIVVDGYDAESHVEALSTREFYRNCRDRLQPGGMLVVNLWGGDRQFNDILRRIEGVFEEGTLCLPAEKPGNIIAFGFRDAPGAMRWSDLAERAGALEAHHALEFSRFVAGLRKMNRHDEEWLYP